MKKNVFIDGEVGTTGLQVYDRLSKHPNVNILKIDQSRSCLLYTSPSPRD